MLKSAEAVRRGHPDKVADQISDAIVDAYLKRDPEARVACETLVKGNTVHLAGEVTSKVSINLESVVRPLIQEIGYTDASWGMDPATVTITSSLSQQSGELSSLKAGAAGDQAIVWGYATNETEEYLPLAYVLAQRLATAHIPLPFLRPDGKVLVTTKGKKIASLVVSLQHDESFDLAQLFAFLQEFYKGYLTAETVYYINQAGSFLIGGPVADAGLTGRKTMVDTYGTLGPHGGGAFSGKDATKVDRSGALAARYIAKNIVASGAVPTCAVQIAYAIGLPDPIALHIEADCDQERLLAWVKERFPLRLPDIIEAFDLKKPIYQDLAFGGVFGGNHPWEAVKKSIAV